MSTWFHAKAEGRAAAAAFRVWGRRIFLVVFGLHLLATVACAVHSSAPAADRLRLIGALTAYALGQALVWGAAAGTLAVLGRLAGWWLLVPVVLVPTGVLVACWLGADAMAAATHDLSNATSTRVQDARWIRQVLDIKILAPLAVMLLLPMVLIHAVTSGTVFAAAVKLLLLSLALVAAGAFGGGAVALPVLLTATVRRLMRRAREREAAALAQAAVLAQLQEQELEQHALEAFAQPESSRTARNAWSMAPSA